MSRFFSPLSPVCQDASQKQIQTLSSSIPSPNQWAFPLLSSSVIFVYILLKTRNLSSSTDKISARMQRRQKHFAKCVYIHCHWSSRDIFPLVFRITIELPCQPASKTAQKRQHEGEERFKLANSGSCICSLPGTTAIQEGKPFTQITSSINT